jgi:UDP-3-O-[3-hydroxymyristoyl] N-acetylglucosamine deacetylase
MHFFQRTIKAPVRCSGIGVHSGKEVNLTIFPAPINHGIKFKRIDLPGSPCIPALFKMVVDTSLATVIGHDGCIVSTIEHLMASFAGLSIDNALVELDAYEMPIMDGSAGPFIDMIKQAGVVDLGGPRSFFIIKEPIEVNQNGKSVAVYPYSSYKITYTIEFDNPVINKQTYSVETSDQTFVYEICRARTFGFQEEYEHMKQVGLAGQCSGY